MRVFVIFDKDQPVDSTLNKRLAALWAKSGFQVKEFPLSVAHGVPIVVEKGK